MSREVATAAKRAATELRSERIAAARPAGSGVGVAPVNAVDQHVPEGSGQARATKTTGGLKKDASSRAAAARRQAKRDAH